VLKMLRKEFNTEPDYEFGVFLVLSMVIVIYTIHLTMSAFQKVEADPERILECVTTVNVSPYVHQLQVPRYRKPSTPKYVDGFRINSVTSN
jgi:hypothetical protein